MQTLPEKDLSLKREGARYAVIKISEAGRGGGAWKGFSLLTMSPHNIVEIIE